MSNWEIAVQSVCKETHVWWPGASGFVVGLVDSVLCLPNGQVSVFGNFFFEEIQIRELLYEMKWNDCINLILD